MQERIWVLCTHCGSSVEHTSFGARPIGLGINCPICGSNWTENQIIASTDGKALSSILDENAKNSTNTSVDVVWLAR